MTASIMWLLGMAMAARYMASTGGPTPPPAQFWPVVTYVLILATWPLWVCIWLLSDLFLASRWPR